MNTDARFAVEHDGTIKYYLSKSLVDRQKLSDDDIWKLVELHKQKLIIFDEMKAALIPEETEKVRALAAQVTKLEFRLQEIWKFPQDENYHYWFDVPHCSCPKMDNRDSYGTSYRYVSASCPIHGKF